MTQKTIYHYEHGTGVFLWAGNADPDPLQPGQFLIPAFATDQAPPDVLEGQRAVFDVQANAWALEDLPLPGETLPASQLSPEERIERLKRGVQMHLDARAQILGYDSIFTAVTYADEPAVPKFQEEGVALRAWRSLVWAKCYELLDAFAAGELAEEPTLDDLIAQLPEFAL